MNIYTEERSYWMGSDVARYRRKRAVSLPDRVSRCGIVHPKLCFGDYEPEHLVIMHLRQYDVTNWRRRALFKLAWVFLRDALRRNPWHLHTPAPASRVKAKRLPAKATAEPAEIKWSHGLHDKPVARVIAYDPETTSLTIAPINNPAADDEQPEVRK